MLTDPELLKPKSLRNYDQLKILFVGLRQWLCGWMKWHDKHTVIELCHSIANL